MDRVHNNDYSGLLKKYQAGNHPVLRTLRDGGVVIGDGVDDHNRLLYVIKRGATITVEYAEGVPAVFGQRPGPRIVVKVQTGS